MILNRRLQALEADLSSLPPVTMVLYRVFDPDKAVRRNGEVQFAKVADLAGSTERLKRENCETEVQFLEKANHRSAELIAKWRRDT